ncbi:MAG: hypothetical protein RSA75_09600 [Bacteroidales bacterium]
MNDVNLLIKAIRVLNGNSPERIIEDEFKTLQNYFPEEYYSFKEYTLYNSDTAKMYKDIRFFNDLYPVKRLIYEEAHRFASQIKAILSPDVLQQHKVELGGKTNLPLGPRPTVQDALRLFSKEYKVEILQSPIIENEAKGCWEINGKIPIKDSKELILAGFSSFSPNYNQLFQSLGLASEFATFEAVCNKKVQWDESYLLAVASNDIVDINEKERRLSSLGANIENCRKILYVKFILFSAAIIKNTLDMDYRNTKSEVYPATFWNDREIKGAFKEYGYISHKVDKKNELVVVYTQRTPANGNPYCLQTFQGEPGVKGFLIPLQNYIQDLYSVKPMHLNSGKKYYYTGGALTEKVKYCGMDNKGGRKFEFIDSKNKITLYPKEILEFVKSTEKQQNKLKI